MEDMAVNSLGEVLVTLWERKYRRRDGEQDADSWMRIWRTCENVRELVMNGWVEK